MIPDGDLSIYNGLTSNQAQALAQLRHEGMPLKVSEVARWTGMSISSTRTALMGLARRGLAKQVGVYWAPTGRSEAER